MIADYNKRQTRQEYYHEFFSQWLAYTFLTGSRRTESFRRNPTITKFEEKDSNGNTITFFKVTRLVEKKFEGRKIPSKINELTGKPSRKPGDKLTKPHRAITTVVFHPHNLSELCLWRFVMAGSLFMNDPEKIPGQVVMDFSPLLQVQKQRPDLISRLRQEAYEGSDPIVDKYMARFTDTIKYKYRCKQVSPDGKQIVDNMPVNPHQLRAARAYELLCIVGLTDFEVMRLIGWDSVQMVYRYAFIRKKMQEMQQVDMWKRHLEQTPTTKSFGSGSYRSYINPN